MQPPRRAGPAAPEAGAPERGADAEAASMAAWLRAHPGFLAANPALYHHLEPPARVHGEMLADHMAAMLRAAREQAASMTARAHDVLEAGRAAAGLAARVQEAVLALMRASDKMDCITAEFPGLLGLDAAALCREGGHPPCHDLPPGTVAGLLGRRDVVFRDAPEDARLLHREAARLARHDALVRVRLPGAPCLLALAARDRLALHPVPGGGALGFLGRAVAAALDG